MMIANRETPYVAGLEGKSGDPSPLTALGTYLGIKAAVKHQRGIDSLKGIKVSVQGVGHVGYYLCKHLHEEGAELVVTDIHQASLDRVASEFGATVVEPQDIYNQDVDVYAPCALGATLNDITLPLLKETATQVAVSIQCAKPSSADL